MLLRLRVFTIAVIIAAAIVNYRPAQAVSLEQAVAIAIENNPDLAIVAKELGVAGAEVERANYVSQFNPQLWGDGDYRHRGGRSNSQDWRVSLSQELEIFGQPALRRQAASLGFERTAAEVRNQMRLLTATVKMTFYEAQRVRRQTELLSDLAGLNRRLADAAQARFDAGEIGQIDFNLARVRYGESRRALIEGRELYRIERSSLGRLLGGTAGAEPEPTGELETGAPRLDIEKLLEVARANRPDLKAARAEIARLKVETALNRRLALPNPTVGTFFGHEQNSEQFGGLSLGLTIPLFNRRQAEASALAARIAQSRDRLRATELNIEREVRDAYRRYGAAREALMINHQDVVAPARESFSLLEAAFTAGKIDLLSLSLAERQAFEARMGYVDAWFNSVAAKVALDLAIGAGA
jgi:outer membrane protein, heavy metal efflux system